MTTLRMVITCYWFMFSLALQADVYSVDQSTPDGVHNQPRWITPQAAEIYLHSIRSPLMQNSHTDHVVSLYFFGDYQDRTLIGLERVKGEDYQQYFSLLVFEKKELLGYYKYVASFPAAVDPDGIVVFPPRFTPDISRSEAAFSLASDVFSDLCLGDIACVEWTAVRDTNK